MIYIDGQIKVCGLTFDVGFDYEKGYPATLHDPAEEPEIDFVEVSCFQTQDIDVELFLEKFRDEFYKAASELADNYLSL